MECILWPVWVVLVGLSAVKVKQEIFQSEGRFTDLMTCRAWSWESESCYTNNVFSQHETLASDDSRNLFWDQHFNYYHWTRKIYSRRDYLPNRNVFLRTEKLFAWVHNLNGSLWSDKNLRCNCISVTSLCSTALHSLTREVLVWWALLCCFSSTLPQSETK